MKSTLISIKTELEKVLNWEKQLLDIEAVKNSLLTQGVHKTVEKFNLLLLIR